jgi:alginate O-acetyltransferase complex protein AlgI
MTLLQIIIIIAICFLYRLCINTKYIDWWVLCISLFVMFWYQPLSTIQTYDFWIPVISLSLGITAWFLVADEDTKKKKENKITGILIVLFVALTGLLRFIPFINIQKFYSIPKFIWIMTYVVSVILILHLLNVSRKKTVFTWFLTGLIMCVFILIKNETLSYKISYLLRKLNNQSTNLAISSEIIWIGYSYVAFRLIHTIIDSKKKHGLNVSLKNYLIYLFYFPSFLAGPIEKMSNFIKEFSSINSSRKNDFISAGKRIFIGLFQKFIIADTLAVFSINKNLATEVTSTFWMWVIVIAYSLRIYFDFNGYTNLAIGTSKILGIKLSENFKHPLRSPTLTIFWNNWHITLTQWFRTYYFNPLTRFIKSKFISLNQQFIIGFMQISTMALIGLWHGISCNFLAWGVWNGIGLFIQNNVSKFFIKNSCKQKPFWQISTLTQTTSIIFTFIYISLGWIWFALPSIKTSLQVFNVLLGNR